jgi:hypothetical protein
VPDDKRIVEIRLLLIVLVDAHDATFAAAVLSAGRTPSVARVVAAEVQSNVACVPYVEAVYTCSL